MSDTLDTGAPVAERRSSASAPSDGERLRVTLFDADGADRSLDADAIDLASLSERKLLWVDVDIGDDDKQAAGADPLLADLATRLGLGTDGRELWRLKGMTQSTPSPTAGDGLLFAGSGSQRGSCSIQREQLRRFPHGTRRSGRRPTVLTATRRQLPATCSRTSW